MEPHASDVRQGMSVPPAAPERNPQVPPPPAPSQSPTPPPAPSPQNVAVQAVAVPQAGVTFTPMSTKSRRRIKRIVVGVVALVVLGVVATVALTIANWTRTPEA